MSVPRSTVHADKCTNPHRIRKKLREMGVAYIDTKGRPKRGRTIGPPCAATCNYECTLNFNPDERIRVHQTFWQSSASEKQSFYENHVKRIATQRHYTISKSRRTYTFIYYFPLRDRRLQVCKKFFLNTLNVCSDVVYNIFKKQDKMLNVAVTL